MFFYAVAKAGRFGFALGALVDLAHVADLSALPAPLRLLAEMQLEEVSLFLFPFLVLLSRIESIKY